MIATKIKIEISILKKQKEIEKSVSNMLLVPYFLVHDEACITYSQFSESNLQPYFLPLFVQYI